MKKYLILDTQNMYHRAIHVAKGHDAYEKGALSLSILLNSIAQAFRIFEADHVVFCLESRSWRRDFDERYKAQRRESHEALSATEKSNNQIILSILDGFLEFVTEKTNCTILRCPNAEADDMIARWIALHPTDIHIIISSDKDFHQLINSNVFQYDGVNKKLFCPNKVSIEIEKLPKDVKLTPIDDPEYLLFKKIVRGDPGDNVFPAYPGAREKGSKNKTGIIDAFNDRHVKGFHWFNFMNQKWKDHNNKEIVVENAFNNNKILIDLTAQPKEILNSFDEFIRNKINNIPERKTKIGIFFMKFCAKYQLNRASERAEEFAQIFKKSYNE